jgi:F-type H+-transporting ATPase subunit a
MQEQVGSHPLWHLDFMPAPFNTVHADTILITWLVMALALLILGVLAATHPVKIVTKRYSILELLVGGLTDLTTSILGKRGTPLAPYIITILVFILLLNEIGLFPFIGKSPTADLNTTAALAITTILLIQVVGIRNKGLGFYRHLVIKPLALGIPMLPFMLIDELARPVTLAMRLFGNIFAGEILLVVAAAVILAGITLGPYHVFGLSITIPISKLTIAAPFAIYFFNLLIGLIQAVVFTLLTIGYLVVPTEESTEH